MVVRRPNSKMDIYNNKMSVAKKKFKGVESIPILSRGHQPQILLCGRIFLFSSDIGSFGIVMRSPAAESEECRPPVLGPI